MTESSSLDAETKNNHQDFNAPIITTRPAELSKNLSEMTIECSTDDPILDTRSEDVKVSTIEKKVKSVFELPQSEVLVDEFPCYIIRLVTLPGWLYLTTNYLCFYSSLRGKKKGPYKAGYLSKKNHITSPRTYRHYFELQNHVLSWYESAESKYSPLGSIDLQVITRIEPSRSKKFGIRLHTKRHRYTIVADSEVSQKEWIDELKKGSFMAHHSGNSVRIVLPFTRVDSIEKPSVFQFAENIKIRLLESDDPNDPAEEYYFAFFPNIEIAYDQIMRTWKQTPVKDQHHLPVLSSSTSTFTGLEGILGNISPAALPTLLIGKLMTVTNMFSNNSPVSEDHSDDTLESENELEPDQMTTTAGTKESKPLNEKQKNSKRLSLFLTKSPENNNGTQENVTTSPKSLSPPSIHSSLTEDEAQTKTRLHSRHSLGKIPAAFKDVIKHQVLRTEDDTPANVGQDQDVRRKRGGSFNTIRQISLSPFSLHNKKTSDPTLSSTTESSQELTVKPKTATRHNRASSIGSFIFNSGSKTLGKLSDHYSKNEEQHHLIWVNRRVLKMAEQHTEEPFNLLTKLSNDEMMPDEMEETQQYMNGQLNTYFPMLLQSESVQAAVKSSFWRTIPYSGKVFMTDKYFCFHSRVLAGQQRLIFPWSDVITVQRIISKSYFLYCGMTMTIKNMTEEIYFDFSTVELRDQCYALCLLKSTNVHDANSIFSGESTPISVSGSSIILDRPEHISPPLEYDGPPLFSSSSNGSSLKYYPPSDSLHITCLTIGSRGDVQPYIALCKGLIKEGHTCRIATHAEYKDWVEGHGIEFRSIGGDPGELMKLCIDNSFLSVSFIREGTKFFYKWFEDLLASSYEACIGTDLIIESPSAMVGVHSAQKLEIPYFRSMPFPFSRTAKFAHPFATHSGSRIYNDMTYVMIDMALWTGTAKIVNRFRREHLGLPSTNLDKLELWKVPYLYSFSPSVVHPPKDWPDYIHCTGYWFLDNPDHKWEPDVQLVQFLELNDNRPIVYIGFGSIIVSDAVELTRTIVEAVLKANIRAIICKGWSSRMADNKGESLDKISDDILKLHPETIYQCDSVPHDWLFPKIQGVVHHGGAGTTAAGLRAGLPTIIKPFFGDQRFWSQRIEELQVGLCLPKITRDKLSEALITITQNKVMIKKAEAVGKSIRQENGVKTAIECIYREFNYAKQLRCGRNGNRNSVTSYMRADEKSELIESESDEEQEEITS